MSYQRLVYLGLILSSIVLLHSCAITKKNSWVDKHHRMLSHAAYEDVPTEQVLDLFAESMIEMMDESLRFTNVTKGAEYAELYFEHNEKEINVILQKLRNHQQNMSTMETIRYLNDLRKKPYAAEVLNLYPKFTKRYKQFTFLMKISKRIRREVGMSVVDTILDEILD